MAHLRMNIGTAGWNLPPPAREPTRCYLEQYATIFNCSEINSTFYHRHRHQTYVRWAASVPQNFCFSVKIPKTLTHDRGGRLTEIRAFLDEISNLSSTLGPLLFQFPPGRSFVKAEIGALFGLLRRGYAGPVVVEPRHHSWASADALKVLEEYHISVVAADPQPVRGLPCLRDPQTAWYFRLHGTPRMYYSSYTDDVLQGVAEKLLSVPIQNNVWCIFDNTAMGAAFYNAFTLQRMIAKRFLVAGSSADSRQGR